MTHRIKHHLDTGNSIPALHTDYSTGIPTKIRGVFLPESGKEKEEADSEEEKFIDWRPPENPIHKKPAHSASDSFISRTPGSMLSRTRCESKNSHRPLAAAS